MSTHAIIGYVDNDKIIFGELFHDGYPSYVGHILLQNYRSSKRLDELFEKGHLIDALRASPDDSTPVKGEEEYESYSVHFTELPEGFYTYLLNGKEWLFREPNRQSFINLNEFMKQIPQVVIDEVVATRMPYSERNIIASGPIVKDGNKAYRIVLMLDKMQFVVITEKMDLKDLPYRDLARKVEQIEATQKVFLANNITRFHFSEFNQAVNAFAQKIIHSKYIMKIGQELGES